MKKILICIFFGFGTFGPVSAQSVTQSTLVSQGEVSEADDLTLEWSIGEVVIHTVNTEDGMLTQGAQQPILQIESLTEVDNDSTKESVFNDIDIQVYPNPTEAIINVDLSSSEAVLLNISLVDGSGKELKNISGTSNQGLLQIDISTFQLGHYFLNLYAKESGELNSFKIVKK